MVASVNERRGGLVCLVASPYTSAIRSFLSFLRKLDREYPKDLDLHLVLDNYRTHGYPQVKAWPASDRASTSTSCPPDLPG